MQTLERHTPVRTGRLASERLDDDFALGVQREVVGFEQVAFIEGGQVVDVDLSCLQKQNKKTPLLLSGLFSQQYTTNKTSSSFWSQFRYVTSLSSFETVRGNETSRF